MILSDVLLPPDVVANRPAASVAGRLFFATDEELLYRDNGSTWDVYQSTIPADTWSSQGNATAHLTLDNAAYNSTFNHSAAVDWILANTTAAVHLTSQSSPIFSLNGTVYDGATSIADGWSLQTVIEDADNGLSTLTFTHSGSSGTAAVRVPLLNIGGTDAGISRLGAASFALGDGTDGDTTGALTLAALTSAEITEETANGGQWIHGQASELLTLDTGGTTTDTSADLLPADSIIEAVVARVTTTITVATDWELGDATTPGRFSAPESTLTAGTTKVGLVHTDQTGASGPIQSAAGKVRVTTTGTPGAGEIRITVFYRQFVAPTS